MKQVPDFHDADIILKLYELRREAVMRKSREIMIGQFWPKTYEEFFAVTQATHDFNAAYRQVSSYWEMAYGFAKHGVVHSGLLLESGGEGLLLFAKIHPHLERFRQEYSPTAFINAEWAATQTDTGRTRFALFQKRVQMRLES